MILIIRPDLSEQNVQLLHNHSQCFIAYFWDTIDIIPRKRDIVHYFERVPSFDRANCDKCGFEFQPISIKTENSQERPRIEFYEIENALNIGIRESQFAVSVFRETVFTNSWST